MIPVTLSSPSLHAASRMSELSPTQLPATPSQLPAEPVQAPATSVDRVTLSTWAVAQAGQAVLEHPVGVSAVSQNEQVDDMAGAVYMNQMARQAIQTYSQTYQMASEMWQTTES